MVAPVQAQVRNLTEQLAKQVVKRRLDQLGDGPLALKITGIRQLTDRACAYELRDVHGADLPEIRAGAHLDVPVRLSDGSLSTRCYSIASSPARRDVYEIAVLREDAGHGGSMGVHEEFRSGLVLHCSVPRNGFVLDNGPDRSVLFSGGIGITPIKAMAHELAAKGRSFELHYAVKSPSNAPFLSELAAAFAQNLTV